jgi:Tol biopolymer transport system component
VLAPSDRWVAFTLALPDGTGGLYLAKAGDQPAAAGTWTKLAEDRNYIGSPAWSSDGKTLYYGSKCDRGRFFVLPAALGMGLYLEKSRAQ